jgi:hypothetical protein
MPIFPVLVGLLHKTFTKAKLLTDGHEGRVAEPENLKMVPVPVPVPTFYLLTVPFPVPVLAPVLFPGHIHAYTYSCTNTYMCTYS